ncbi:hypothetical protein ACW9HQ_49785, partial [Nocardia gipuzkoensis]
MKAVTPMVTAALLVATSILSAACSGSPHSGSGPATDTDRGRVVSAEHLRAFTVDEVKAELDRDRFDASTARFGVDTYRLVYRTIDADG